MSGKRTWWILIILFLSTTLAGLFLEFSFSETERREVDVRQFEQKIQQHQRGINQMLKALPSDFPDNSKQVWAFMDSISGNPYDLLVYRNNHLVAWSDHQLPVQDIHPVFFNQSFIQLDNGYYLVQRFRSDPYFLVGLFKIKHSFPHTNQYLHDDFLFSTGLSPSVNIVRDSDSSFEPVFGLEGEYLFSLTRLTMQRRENFTGIIVLSLFFLAVFALWGLVFLWLQKQRGKKGQNMWLGLSVLLFSVVFYYLFWHNDMMVFSRLELFSPLHFAMSDLFSSLGALLLFSLWGLLVSFLVFNFFRWPSHIKNENRPLTICILFFIGVLVVQGIMLSIVSLLYNLVEHSSGPAVFFKVIEINDIAIVKIVILSFLFFAFLLVTEKMVRLFLFRLKRIYMCLLTLAGSLVFVFFQGGIGFGGNDWAVLFTGLVILLLLLVKRDFRLYHSYNSFLWLVALFALFIGSVMIDLSIGKEEEERELLVENLSYQLLREEDPVAEMHLEDIESQILRDAPLRQLLAQNNINQSAVRNHLLKYYFYGYWGRYDLQVVPCWPDGELIFEESGAVQNCYQYFFSILQEQGRLINGSNHFYYLNNDNGRVSYLGVFKFFEGHPLETTLFLELQSKPFFEGLGYPELLVSQKEQDRLALFDDYSYAKYVDGRLVKRSGDYDYHGAFRESGVQEAGGKEFIKEEGYSHIVFRPESDTVVILSRKDYGVADIFIAFSVFFIFFFIIGVILSFLTQLKRSSFSFKLSIQKRLQFSFVGLMLIILLVVAVGTVLYTVKQFKGKHEDLLNEKVQSVLLDMESKVGFEGPLNNKSEEYLTYQLQTISNVFFCDVNLFGPDGKLMASSRPELFEEGLIGDRMNPSAYYNLAINQESRYLDEETIGNLEYTSYYVPFFSPDDVLLGYVNVPYFVANSELREEVSSVVMTVVNFYLFFSFIVIGIGVFLARQITRPLMVLQNKLADLKIDRQNEKIDYHGDDEIGSLVGEYNRMVDELEASASKLARTQRELAWREMARQIAHEIKNPLTPMKLSIQYLQRAWNDQVPDFDSFLKRVTGTLIDQIEKLSSIATEFSHFAKMPAARRENVNLLDKIRNSVVLFSNSSEVNIVTDFKGYRQIIVHADGEQLLGVFNNLIKNAVQSIPRDKQGEIRISVSVNAGFVTVAIHDNGRGISEEIREKMFVPNFTTKSGGTGLGLAIAKSTVESSGGEIWFETRPDEGTTFYVQLPVVSQS